MTTTEPFFDRLRTEFQLHDWFHHGPYHHDQVTTTPGAAAMNNLIETIKTDLANAGHPVDEAVHDILAHRLNIASVLTYAVDEVNRIQANPLSQVAEKWAGLPPAAVDTVVHVMDVVAGDAAKLLTGPQPA